MSTAQQRHPRTLTAPIALVLLVLVLAGCSSDSGDSGEGGSAASEGRASTSAPTTTAPPPTTTPVTALPPAANVPVARVGGENERAPDELNQWAAEHDLTVEWYTGGATLTAVFRGLDLTGLPPLCLTTAIAPQAFTDFEGETIAPTGEGGCNGATGQVGSIDTCHDLAVYPTAIAIAPVGRLFANIQLWEDGAIVADLSSLESLDAVPPPFDRTALGC